MNSYNSEFVAVYGRRRVGKTYLIRETFNYKFTFQHTGKCRNLLGFGKTVSFFPLHNRPLRDTARICKLGLGHFLIDPQFFDQVDVNRPPF